MTDLIHPYELVRVITDRFAAEGVPRGSVGYAIEEWEPGVLEVAFTDPETGHDWAMITARDSDLDLVPVGSKDENETQ